MKRRPFRISRSSPVRAPYAGDYPVPVRKYPGQGFKLVSFSTLDDRDHAMFIAQQEIKAGKKVQLVKEDPGNWLVYAK